MKTRPASCSCGRLSLIAEGEPIRVSVCHCLACQRRTGSPFAAQARFPRSAVAITGDSTSYVRVGDEGGAARFHFCPVCGVTLFYVADAFPDQVAIPVGVFADPGFPPPGTSIYGVRQHRWVQLSDSIAQYD